VAKPDQILSLGGGDFLPLTAYDAICAFLFGLLVGPILRDAACWLLDRLNRLDQ